MFFFKYGPIPASFCLFSFFSQDKYGTNTLNDKSVVGVFGTRTQGSRMVGTDESTELWRHPNFLFLFFKMGLPRPLFVYFCLFEQTLHFFQQINVKNVHPVFGAGIWTHNHLIMSLLPEPLDQCSRPTIYFFIVIIF